MYCVNCYPGFCSEEKKNRIYELTLHEGNNSRKLENGCGRSERMMWSG
jgi:hypothetical protein